MLHDGKQIFWVGHNHPYNRFGYLPALDPKPEPLEEVAHYHHRPHTHTYTKKQAGRLFLRMESLEDDMSRFHRDMEYLKKKEAEKIRKKGTY